jgi:alanyl-tRNA synthetase
VCGSRALRTFDALRDTVIGCVRQLSVLPSELPDAIGRLQADGKELQRTIRSLQERLAGFEAHALVSRAMAARDWRAAIEIAPWDAVGLKALATAATTEPRLVVVLFNPAGGLLVVARSPDVAFDASATLKALVAKFGGRGGGRPELAQGGGLSGSPEAILEEARQLVAPGGDTR